MTTRSAALVVVLGVPLFLLALDRALALDPSRRNIEVFYEMVNSVAGESYSENAAFANGITQQAPPPFTIARGALARETLNPYGPDDRAALERGAAVYANHCAACHGAGGAGDGAVVRRGVPAPPAFTADRMARLSDVQLEKLIADGGKAPLDEPGAAAPLDQPGAAAAGNMPAYRAQVPRADRWKAVLHVRKLAGGGP